jgi:hypothetical protein
MREQSPAKRSSPAFEAGSVPPREHRAGGVRRGRKASTVASGSSPDRVAVREAELAQALVVEDGPGSIDAAANPAGSGHM